MVVVSDVHYACACCGYENERQDYPGDDGALIVTFLQISDTLLHFTKN